MHGFGGTLKYAYRAVRGSVATSLAVVLTFALGIGVTTAVFSIVYGVLLRPLPYPESDRLVRVWLSNPLQGYEKDITSYPNFVDWREQSRSIQRMAAVARAARNLTGAGEPRELLGAAVSEGYFGMLRVAPVTGRVFTAEEESPGGPNVVILSHELWVTQFGSDPAIAGRALSLSGEPYEVVGVMPPGLGEQDFWIPLRPSGGVRESRSVLWLPVIGRLAPGVSLEQARADLDRVALGIAADLPATNATSGVTVAPLREHLVGNARTPLLVLLGAVGLVLLIACANVANLLLARGTEREREFAVRAALGAQRGRLARQLLTESVLLGLLGGILGVLLAFWGVELIKAMAPADIPRIHAVTVDLRILAFALVMTLATALVFGLAPASQSWRASVQSALKSVHGIVDPARLRLRAALIVSEIALALTLLVGAGLLLRSFAALVDIDPGFQKEGVVALQVFAWDRRDSLDQRVRFFEETERRIAALPGVTTVGAVMNGPFTATDIGMRRRLVVQGGEPAGSGEEMQVYLNHATPGYFMAIGTPLIRGRAFEATDRAGAPPVAVINDAARRLYWRGTDPIGSRVLVGETKTPIAIVGVVGDTRLKSLEQPARPEIVLSQRQTGWASMTYYVRTSGDLAATMDAAKREVWAVDPLQDFYQTATLENLMATTLAPRRFSMLLLGTFAVIALLLAAVGIYGVISFVVKRRTHEMGIRLALGAAPRNVVRLVVTHGVRLAGIGLALGLAGALVASRALTSMLFDIAAWDVATFALATVTLFVVALIAAYLPARRASRVDPMIALRTE